MKAINESQNLSKTTDSYMRRSSSVKRRGSSRKTPKADTFRILKDVTAEKRNAPLQVVTAPNGMIVALVDSTPPPLPAKAKRKGIVPARADQAATPTNPEKIPSPKQVLQVDIKTISGSAQEERDLSSPSISANNSVFSQNLTPSLHTSGPKSDSTPSQDIPPPLPVKTRKQSFQMTNEHPPLTRKTASEEFKTSPGIRMSDIIGIKPLPKENPSSSDMKEKVPFVRKISGGTEGFKTLLSRMTSRGHASQIYGITHTGEITQKQNITKRPSSGFVTLPDTSDIECNGNNEVVKEPLSRSLTFARAFSRRRRRTSMSKTQKPNKSVELSSRRPSYKIPRKNSVALPKRKDRRNSAGPNTNTDSDSDALKKSSPSMTYYELSPHLNENLRAKGLHFPNSTDQKPLHPRMGNDEAASANFLRPKVTHSRDSLWNRRGALNRKTIPPNIGSSAVGRYVCL